MSEILISGINNQYQNAVIILVALLTISDSIISYYRLPLRTTSVEAASHPPPFAREHLHPTINQPKTHQQLPAEHPCATTLAAVPKPEALNCKCPFDPLGFWLPVFVAALLRGLLQQCKVGRYMKGLGPRGFLTYKRPNQIKLKASRSPGTEVPVHLKEEEELQPTPAAMRLCPVP